VVKVAAARQEAAKALRPSRVCPAETLAVVLEDLRVVAVVAELVQEAQIAKAS
jgi:hypothetical protein